ncbi:MAG: bifunctional nuclease family protein [Bacteroidetes bacterium]|nr:bifunctional nuclease family protein [Bacteroidota bacterium]MCW5895845.1 bifunctional nuclease family protein [Bacteroidota bacterium]
MDKVQVDILGLSTNPASGGAYALILKEVHGNRRLPIIIGASEAQSIALEMEGIKPPRPLTHDLMKNIISSFGAELSDVVIDELRDGTFYAKLNIDSQLIDSRPSDAIALAVRYGVQIFVAAPVMEEAAFIPEEEEEEGLPHARQPRSKSASPPTKMTKLEQLNLQLKEAIEKENYEKAATLRDEIRKLELRD